MHNTFTRYDNEKERQKKITVVKCVERRTANGKLISTTKSVIL